MQGPHIKKLNKRLIYGLLMAGSIIIIPLMVIPMATTREQKNSITKKSIKPYIATDHEFSKQQSERFPNHYKIQKAAVQTQTTTHDSKPTIHTETTTSESEAAVKALEKLASLKRENNNKQYFSKPPSEEDPWQNAAKKETKRRAMDYYNARRSEIMFIDNKENRKTHEGHNSQEDRFINLMEESLRAQNEGATKKDDNVFFNASKENQAIGKLTSPERYMISEGTLIPITLLSEINTDLKGPILGRVTKNIYDSALGKYILIPQNSKIIGEYSNSIGYGQNRALIIWKRIIFPNQVSINLGSMVGVDAQGVSGASGNVNNHYDKIGLGLIMTTAISGGVRLAQGKYDQRSSSVEQEMGHSFAQEAAKLGNKVTNKILSIPPTITIPMGKVLNVFVKQDLKLRPYSHQ